MKFEKLNENKIRITLSSQDLIDEKIDFHSFMANSVETQHFFLDMLDKAEKEVGFITKDYKVKLDALAMNDGDFILTVTRFEQIQDSEKNYKRKIGFKRKKANLASTQAIYSFNSFDDFDALSTYLKVNNITDYSKIAKNITLYFYKNTYFLILTDIDLEYSNFKKFYSSITEFATYLTNSEIFISKLIENGKVILKNNAFKIYDKKLCAKQL